MQLTIIIPVFNCEPYLKMGFQKLKSIYKTDISFEIIYVNDGSTDESKDVLEALKKEHSHVIVIHQENQGSSGARNTAIEIAKGEYIQFLDADDLLDVEKIIEMLSEAKNNNFDLLGYRMDFVDETYNLISEKEKDPLSYNKPMSGIDCLIEGYQPASLCVFLFKRALLTQNKLRIYPKITHMDIEFMTRVMLCAKKVIFKDTIAYHYLQRPGSITKPKTKEKLEKFLFDEVIISKLIRENIKNYDIIDQETIEAIEKNYNSIVWNLIWRFITRSKEVNRAFKSRCLEVLKEDELYPIKGALKTKFQKVTRLGFNQKTLLSFTFRLISNK